MTYRRLPLKNCLNFMRVLLAIFIVNYTCVFVFGNGGPIDGSSVVKTGRIKMLSVYGINIASEKIDIKIEGDYAVYNILYRFYMENNSNDSISYGFPVDYTYAVDESETPSITFKDSYIPYFKMYFQNKELLIKQQIDFEEYTDSVNFYKGFEGSSVAICKRKWYISSIVFDKSGFYELRVQYKVKNYFSDWVFSKSFQPRYTERTLKYDLTPATYWDKGIIDTFSVRINVQNLDSCYESYKIIGLKNSKNINGIIEFKQNKYNLKKSKYFALEYTNSNQHLSNYIFEGILPKERFLCMDSCASSVSEMFDNNFGTATKIKSNGCLYFDMNKSKISAIYLLNGDYSDSLNYYRNSKVKKIRVTFDYFYDDESGEVNKIDTVIQLNNYPFRELKKNNFANNADLIFDFGESVKINKLVIRIIEPVYFNTKDIYFSEIIFTRDTWSREE